MSDSVEYRKRVLEYIAEGNKQAEAIKIFKVSRTAIHEWKKQRILGVLHQAHMMRWGEKESV